MWIVSLVRCTIGGVRTVIPPVIDHVRNIAGTVIPAILAKAMQRGTSITSKIKSSQVPIANLTMSKQPCSVYTVLGEVVLVSECEC